MFLPLQKKVTEDTDTSSSDPPTTNYRVDDGDDDYYGYDDNYEYVYPVDVPEGDYAMMTHPELDDEHTYKHLAKVFH